MTRSLGGERDLGVERVEVFTRALVVARHDLVARAVVADRLAERDMDVDRKRTERAAGGGALAQRLLDHGRREAVVKAVGGRVRRVARAGRVEPAQQRLGQHRGHVVGEVAGHGRMVPKGARVAIDMAQSVAVAMRRR